MSRQNMILTRNARSECLGLVPLYDMVNHEPGQVASYFDAKAKGIELCANRDFVAGSELTMSYGGRPNTELLVFQGFAVADNHNDSVVLTVEKALGDPEGPPPSDPIAVLRTRMLENMDILPQTHAMPFLASAAIRAAASTGKPASPATIPEADRWRYPFQFEVNERPYGGIVVPQALMSFCRVAALNKPDAVTALRLVQREMEAAAMSSAASAPSHGHSHGGQPCGGHGHAHGGAGGGGGSGGGGSGGGGHGHSHGGQPCGGHGHAHGGAGGGGGGGGHGHSHGGAGGGGGGGGHGHSHGGQPCSGHHAEEAEDDHDDECEDDCDDDHGHSHGGYGHEEEPPAITLPRVSDANEEAARTLAAAAAQRLLDELGAPSSSSGRPAGAGGAGEEGPARSPFIRVYVEQQRKIAESALIALRGM
jgi:hypothetical protein